MDAKENLELIGIARIKIHEGKLDEFKRVSRECIDIARALDTGTLEYAVYIGQDSSEAMIIERYKDSQALIEHIAHIGDRNQEILATGIMTGVLLGKPNAALLAMMASSPVQIFTSLMAM